MTEGTPARREERHVEDAGAEVETTADDAPRAAGGQPPRAPEGAFSGVTGLDRVLGGGFARNRLHLVEGAPGAGKTTLALQFLLEGLERGEAGLLVSFSETRAELAQMAASHGWSLGDLVIVEALPDREELLPAEDYTLFQPMEVELGETIQRLLGEVERVRPARVAFDPISHLRLMARDPLVYRRQILALRRYFIDHSCTVLLLDNAPDPSGPGYQLRTAAHSVMLLEQRPQEYGSDRRRVRLLKVRGIDFKEGYHDMSIETGGVVVYPRIEAGEDDDGEDDVPRELLSSGIFELDALTGGGLARGTSALIMGPAGVGKSTTAALYAAAAAERGEDVAVFTFEESHHTYLRRMEALGIPLRTHWRSGLIRLRRVEPAEWSAGEFSERVRREVDDGARLLVIDSLNGYLRSLSQEAHLPLHLRELLTHVGAKGTIVLLTLSQHGIVGQDPAVAVELTYLTDAVLLLRYFEAGGRIRKAISMIKNRASDHERTIREFELAEGGIVVGEPLTGFQGVLRGVPDYMGLKEDLFGSAAGGAAGAERGRA